MSISQEAQFTLLLNNHIDKLNEKWRHTFTIDQETYDKIMFAVQLPKGKNVLMGVNSSSGVASTLKLKKSELNR